MELKLLCDDKRCIIMKKILLTAFLAMAMTTGCAPKQPPIHPLSAGRAVQTVCIEINPSVQFAEFLPAVIDGFTRHGLKSQVYSGDQPKNCAYTVRYSATRGWDVAFFLATASVAMFQGKEFVAGFGYVFDGPFSKFGSVQSKIAPRMDAMLADYR
jgi:hypothetical protein